MDAAAQIGVDPNTVPNWETAGTEVEVRSYPALIQFLGYNPPPQAQTQGQAIGRARLSRGLSQVICEAFEVELKYNRRNEYTLEPSTKSRQFSGIAGSCFHRVQSFRPKTAQTALVGRLPILEYRPGP